MGTTASRDGYYRQAMVPVFGGVFFVCICGRYRETESGARRGYALHAALQRRVVKYKI